LRRFFEEVSARDVEAILDRIKVDDIAEEPAETAKAAKPKCAPGPTPRLGEYLKHSV